MAASATFALKAGVWFRRARLFIVSPDSPGTACPLSGRNSTYRPVQILEASSMMPFPSLNDLDTLLTRDQTAEALTQAGYPVKSKTLATKASRGGGPPFAKFGPRALY